jgi:hypothetical protein
MFDADCHLGILCAVVVVLRRSMEPEFGPPPCWPDDRHTMSGEKVATVYKRDLTYWISGSVRITSDPLFGSCADVIPEPLR